MIETNLVKRLNGGFRIGVQTHNLLANPPHAFKIMLRIEVREIIEQRFKVRHFRSLSDSQLSFQLLEGRKILFA